MAGGKETPRQKMIGMMYLVLTALLALNVSKEIINAFVKLDKKLMEANANLINTRDAIMHDFEERREFEKITQKITDESKSAVAPWQKKAKEVMKMAYAMDKYINIDCKNKMIEEIEKKTFVTADDKAMKFTTVDPMEIQTKDDYDVATRLFGGEPGTDGFANGAKLRDEIHAYRDKLLAYVTEYEGKDRTGKKKKFKINVKNIKVDDLGVVDEKSLKKELEDNVSPADHNSVRSIYKCLTLPAKLADHEETVDWQLGMFDHAPIVAASALFTALSNDVRNAEVEALKILISRCSVEKFSFNKIEPMAFARTGYLNMGDSMPLIVNIAAYDSTKVPEIRYGVDADTANPTAWKTIKGKIGIVADNPGKHVVKGEIGVEEQGVTKWKPWKFIYEVGKPMGVIANADLNVLYVGLDNKIEATASGYPSEKITLGGAPNTKSGEFFIVKPGGKGGNTVTLTVSAEGKVLGKKDFKVRRLPIPLVYVGTANNTTSTIKKTDLARGTLSAAYDASVPLNAKFSVNGFTMVVAKDGVEKKMVSNSSAMTADMKNIVNVLKAGSTVSFKDVRISGPAGPMAGPAMVFTIQ